MHITKSLLESLFKTLSSLFILIGRPTNLLLISILFPGIKVFSKLVSRSLVMFNKNLFALPIIALPSCKNILNLINHPAIMIGTVK